MLKRQFHETLSFIQAIFDDKFRKEFIKRTRIHMTFGEKKVMDEKKFDEWVEEWERKNE
jgi:hypothetical protein